MRKRVLGLNGGGKCGGMRLGRIGNYIYSQSMQVHGIGETFCHTKGTFFKLHMANRTATVRHLFPRPATRFRAAAKSLRAFSGSILVLSLAHTGDLGCRLFPLYLLIEGRT
jgi:hypothetical protein